MSSRKRPTECMVCGKPGTRRRLISYWGKCGPCGEKAAADAAREMKAKSGPTWDRYVAAMTRVIGAVNAPGVSPESDVDQDAAAL